MILIDTTVWIDFLGRSNQAHVKKLIGLINDNENICINGVILTEVLQGIKRDDQYKKVRKHLNSLIFLSMGYDVFDRAANIYRLLRSKSITVRKPIDCIIASTAIEYNAKLLHNDRDFDPIVKYCGLKAIRK